MKNKIFITILLLSIMTFSALSQEKKSVCFVIETDKGNIEGYLYDDTPLHRDNFVKLINEGWYNGSDFHRVIPKFMIQGGQSKDGGDKDYTIENEILPNHFHKKGALAAARLGDQVNPEKRSSPCQFYIVQGDVFSEAQLKQMEQNKNQAGGNFEKVLFEILQRPENQSVLDSIKAKSAIGDNDGIQALLLPFMPEVQTILAQKPAFHFTDEQIKTYATVGGSPHLDGDYTVFGEITSGFEVVDKIAAVKTGGANKPIEAVKMNIKIK